MDAETAAKIKDILLGSCGPVLYDKLRVEHKHNEDVYEEIYFVHSKRLNSFYINIPTKYNYAIPIDWHNLYIGNFMSDWYIPQVVLEMQGDGIDELRKRAKEEFGMKASDIGL